MKMPPKSKVQRVKEGVTLLKKLSELPPEMGMVESDKGYIQIRNAITEWAITGTPSNLKIPLHRQGRVAELSLPSDGATATLALKVLPPLPSVEDMD